MEIPATILFILDIGPTETHINYLKCGSRINKKHLPGSPVAVFDHEEPPHGCVRQNCTVLTIRAVKFCSLKDLELTFSSLHRFQLFAQ